jgi:hypothetical protein
VLRGCDFTPGEVSLHTRWFTLSRPSFALGERCRHFVEGILSQWKHVGAVRDVALCRKTMALLRKDDVDYNVSLGGGKPFFSFAALKGCTPSL